MSIERRLLDPRCRVKAVSGRRCRRGSAGSAGWIPLPCTKSVGKDWPGLKHANIIKTGDRSYCLIAEWAQTEAMAAARQHMIGTLNSFREMLEDLGDGRGVTDAVSGPVVMALK